MLPPVGGCLYLSSPYPYPSSSPSPCLHFSPKDLKILQATSLSILEGEALRLRCEADSNPPAELSWFRGSPGLNATPLSSTAILELPRVGPAQEGEFTCQARHPLGSHSVSLSLSVVCEWGDPGGQDSWVLGRLEAPLTLLLAPHRPPAAAGTLLLLGGPGSALQLLLQGPAGPLPALAAGGGAAGGEPWQRVPRGHLQLRGALDQQLPEPQGGAQP